MPITVPQYLASTWCERIGAHRPIPERSEGLSVLAPIVGRGRQISREAVNVAGELQQSHFDSLKGSANMTGSLNAHCRHCHIEAHSRSREAKLRRESPVDSPAASDRYELYNLRLNGQSSLNTYYERR